MRKAEDCERWVSEAGARYGRLDILVNCAAGNFLVCAFHFVFRRYDWCDVMALNGYQQPLCPPALPPNSNRSGAFAFL